jgi:murein DD-endopeptidase MepM/ murein hydrolase activator NlpD
MRPRILFLFLSLSFLLTACATAAAYSNSQPLAVAQLPTDTPLPTATATDTATPTETPSETPTATFTLTLTPSLTPSQTATFTESATPGPSQTFTRTLTPSRTPSSTRTVPPTRTPTFTPSLTFTPSQTYTPSATTTRAPSNTPDSRIQTRSTYTPYPPAVFPTGDASKLKKPPASVTNEPHLIFDRPVSNSAPSSQYRFGMTYDGRLAPHHGVDIAPVPGAMVGAAGTGTVFFAGPDQAQVFGTKENFYGNLVVLQMNQTWEGHAIFTLYGHLDSLAVTIGQQVNTGDLLGIVGATGIAYGPHLHFEVRLDDPYSYFGSVRNPELWYRPLNGGGVIAGRLINADGRFIPGARLFITCKDALRFVDTYWDQGTPPDNVLVENFAMSDIPQGNCNLETTVNGKLYRTSVYVPPGEVAFVVIQTEDK